MTSTVVRQCLGALASIVFLAVSAPAVAQTGFAWAHKESAQNYTPDPTYSYNSRGGAIQIGRSSIGAYKVNFVGLGGRGIAGGNVQVTTYGPNPVTCNVEKWLSGQNDFTVYVRCFKLAGSPVDIQFSVLVGWWCQ